MLSSELLKGKTAIITGCNRGIGKTMLELFAANGCNLIACARKESTAFDHDVDEIRKKYSAEISTLHFELTSEESVKNALTPLLTSKTRVDILVNNAGVAHGGFLQMTSLKSIREVFDINFFAQISMIQIISKLMMRQKSGSIINIASVAGIDAHPGYIAYGSSKAALIYAAKTLAIEFAPYNIRINSIAPGLTETDMASQMETKAKANLINDSAMKRMAQPVEIANMALFLASDLSSFVNGQVLRVDGGM